MYVNYWNRRYGRWSVCCQIIALWSLCSPVSTPNFLLLPLFFFESCVVIFFLGLLRRSNVSWLWCVTAAAIDLGLDRSLCFGFFLRTYKEQFKNISEKKKVMLNKLKTRFFTYKIVPTFLRFGVPFLGHLSVVPAGSKFNFNFVAIFEGSVTVFSIRITQLNFFSLRKMRAIFPLTVCLPNNLNFVVYRHYFWRG